MTQVLRLIWTPTDSTLKRKHRELKAAARVLSILDLLQILS